jgi:hypothetical protein
MADDEELGSEALLPGGMHLQIRGSFLRIARLDSEFHDDIGDPLAVVSALRSAKRPAADLFTFVQRIPDTAPKYPGLFMELDNVAAIPITTYQNWWTRQVNDKTRNMARRFEKKGGVVKVAAFDDLLVSGISGIYNEVPFRQGKKFWHYGKPLEVVKAENATFADRTVFIGAYYEGELVGFAKLVCEPAFASLMQILSMVKHRDKSPTNALLAKAVEVAAERKIPYLVYAKFVYGRKGEDTLSDFKRHNAFERIDLPRYYVPLTWRGRLALGLRLHNGLVERLPQGLVVRMLDFRSKWYERRTREH